MEQQVEYKKTYKREVSFAFMAIVVLMFIYSIVIHPFHPETAEFASGVAKFMMPFASIMLSAAIGVDWWVKQGPGQIYNIMR